LGTNEKFFEHVLGECPGLGDASAGELGIGIAGFALTHQYERIVITHVELRVFQVIFS